MALVAYVVSKLQTVKVMVRQISEWPRFIAPFYGQHVKGSQTLVKSPWEYFYQIIFSLWENLTWKTSQLVIFELLRVFVKPLTPNDKYSLCIIWNLPELIQMLLSKKKFLIFFTFLEICIKL